MVVAIDDISESSWSSDGRGEREENRTMLRIEIDREVDGRWIAEVTALPGVMTYGASRDEAVAKAEALALRVLADRVEHGEAVPELELLFSAA
jgi:predicted RNase H-like HicB family nuclease